MLERSGVGPDEEPLLESALRRAGELEFLVEGLELVGAGPSIQGVAYPLEAIRAASERLGDRADNVDVPAEAWPGISQRYLERVTYDLLSNAVHHGMRPITIEAFRENGDAHLVVSDEGGWEAQPEHFQAFFQQDMSETRARGGFGLGLFLASRLCQAAGGELTVDSVGGKTIADARFRIK
jgi:signal transduction histidine kinase